MSDGPLRGLRILEIAATGPCPCAGMVFADLGAEVLVVERAGDAAAPPSDPLLAQKVFYNRGKQSIVLDLKHPQAVGIVLDLAARSDALIEGFRPGVMERLGLGPEACQARNGKLVYGRLTGWGQDGPLAVSAGHEPNYMGVSGALWYGARGAAPPTAPLTALGDFGGGTLSLVTGVLAAMLEAGRTGRGRVVDAAISDGSAYASSLLWLLRGVGQLGDAPDSGWPNGAAPWNAVYRCADGGYLAVCALEPPFYRSFIDGLDLADDELFAEQWNTRSWPEARERLAALIAKRPRDEWMQRFEGRDACVAPVLSFDEALAHPHNQARGTFLSPGGVHQPAPTPRFDDQRVEPGAVPTPGADTASVLEALGIDGDAYRKLQAAGVFGRQASDGA